MKVVVYSKDINLIDRYEFLLMNYNYEIFSNYDDLFIESKKRSVVILANIEECGDNIESFITPLVNQYCYLMILDSIPTYEKGKRLISLGVRGYGNLYMDDIHLKEAINTIEDGNIWLYPEFINETIHRMRYENKEESIDEKLSILTQREKEVALLVIKKYTYQEISDELKISLRTVKAHTKNIYEKFNVLNRLSFILLFN
ncbi:response regulator transcription factor [Arcobacter sp. YIC-464]|uniref:response regulator transcription factor n=1 Tax=Arcobacter sp. YIC-464 TaxID=3376631 RepID=UPI003C284321